MMLDYIELFIMSMQEMLTLTILMFDDGVLFPAPNVWCGQLGCGMLSMDTVTITFRSINIPKKQESCRILLDA